MSRTYDLVCHDCKLTLWIGQSYVGGRHHIYTDEEHLEKLNTFLFLHKNHHLEFGDDEGISCLEYDSLDDDEITAS